MAHPSTSFKRHIRYTLAVLMVLVGVFVVYVSFEKTIDAANHQRLRSVKLADEMRRSSDDLSRLYVVTGDALYQRSYETVLDVREGRSPRPHNEGILSLDLRSDAAQPARGGDAVALLDLMRRAGFTDEELALLTQSKTLSDELTHTEREAMRLREVQGSGAEASHARALALLHDEAYLATRRAIMQPIERF